MHIEAHKNSGFKEEFTYLEPKMIKPTSSTSNNNNNLYRYEDTTDNFNIKLNCRKIEKGKSDGSTLFFKKIVNINIENIF